MKLATSRFMTLSLLLALLAAAIPVPVYAALGIVSVVPNQVVNDTFTTITVTGTDFISGSVVLLDGYGALSTNFQNSSVLTATVPAGVPAGAHNVTVSTGAETVSCSGCLTVLVPTPIPPTPTPTATNIPLPFTRPQFVVKSSKTNGNVATGDDFKLTVVVKNVGTSPAYSAQAVFSSSDLVPLKNGGVVALGSVSAEDQVSLTQSFHVTAETYGQVLVMVDVAVTYYDENGISYSDKFTMTIYTTGTGVNNGIVYPTSTPTSVKSSQLVITGYSTNVDPLQPGEQFALKLKVQNVGNANAQRVTMIVGGGSSGGSDNGTPQPGGVSGGSGEFSNFAPVSASNIQSLGNLPAGESVEAVQQLIVNVSTDPGAYPMKITLSYLNDKNEVINDEQVITLLVYSLPSVDVSFYRPLDPFYVDQPGMLPIQVVNLGKRISVLGNMMVEVEDGTVDNGNSLIGPLDAGGYFTLDSMLTSQQSGTTKLNITIDYVDDFNQPRTITKSLEVQVLDMAIEPTLDPSVSGGGGGGGEVPMISEETNWHKVWRFILGLLGLDSSGSSGSETAPPAQQETVPVKPIPGKG